MSLLFISQQLTIYVGIFLICIGTVGNGLNILIFSTTRTYRTTPCTFYFLISSIFNIAYILINLTSRIVSAGYGIDLTRTSNSWCKARAFFLVSLSLISITCSCLATIDQFLVSSRNAGLRRYSSIKWSHRIVIIIIIFWCLHGIPWVVFYNISPLSNTCVNNNDVMAIYNQIYLFVFVCGIPVILMVLFGCLTYRNIRQTIALAEQNADRQITRMTLIQVGLLVSCIIPYTIVSAYNLITAGVTKDVDRQMKEYIAYTISSLGTYFYYAGSCYMFFISSSRFRRAMKDRVLCRKRRNPVFPLQATTIG